MAGSRSALIVATYRYDDARLRMLQAPEHDAEALAEVLGDQAIGAFDVKTVVNQSAHDISVELAEFFAHRHSDDVLLVHFSCHGVKDDSGELFLAATDTRMDLLDATAVPSAYVNKVMTRSRSGCVVLLLDCCYAGAFARGLTRAAGDVDVTDRFGGRGRAVITASTALQYAFEGDSPSATPDLGAPSMFTRALVNGLRSGEADRNSDGIVSLDELYAHVHDEVTRVNPDQTPQKWLFDVAGDLFVAKRATPVTVPSTLRPELQESMHSLLAWERQSVVAPLQDLLRGTHPGLALAARLALQDLADHDDSMKVREAARAALASAPVVESTPILTPTDGREADRSVVEEVQPDTTSTTSNLTENDTTTGDVIGEAVGGGGFHWTGRRWVLPAVAGGVAVALVAAFFVARGGGGGGDTSLSPSTLLLSVGDRLTSYDVVSHQRSTMPMPGARGPSISADRRWISYSGPTGPRVVRADGRSQDQALPGVGPGSQCANTNRPTWSPDGRMLAMICRSAPGPASGLLVARQSDGWQPQFVVHHDWVCCGVTWMNNDTLIVGRYTPSGSELVEVSATGGGEPKVVIPGDRYAHDPDWSDRGGLVYVESTDSPFTAGQIRVEPPSQLASNGAGASTWTSPGVRADYPAWDPSGRRLAYLRTQATTRKHADYRLFIAAAANEGAPAPGVPTGQLGPPAWGSR